MDTFGSRLRIAREFAGLSQAELARRAGLAQAGLSRLEKSGKGSSHTPALAALLNVSPRWLATGDGERNPAAMSLEAQRIGFAIDAMSPEQRRSFMAVWLAFGMRPVSDAQVEIAMPATRRAKV
ncbi:MAG: helix-turn-helix domain-containing protein [Burkholderiaceae bacterium]